MLLTPAAQSLPTSRRDAQNKQRARQSSRPGKLCGSNPSALPVYLSECRPGAVCRVRPGPFHCRHEDDSRFPLSRLPKPEHNRFASPRDGFQNYPTLFRGRQGSRSGCFPIARSAHAWARSSFDRSFRRPLRWHSPALAMEPPGRTSKRREGDSLSDLFGVAEHRIVDDRSFHGDPSQRFR